MSYTPKNLTHDELLEKLIYNPLTGEFRWLVASGRGGRYPAGKIAGSISKISGYRHIGLGGSGKNVLASRLAWFWMTGAWPVHSIDHINHDKADDRWANLREATATQNKANSPLYKNNTSGIKGVSYDASARGSKKWRARISVNGKVTSAGRYATQEEAAQAYWVAAQKQYGEFASQALAA